MPLGRPRKYKPGQQVGHLTIIKFAGYGTVGNPMPVEPKAGSSTFYETRCKCGKTANTSTSLLRRTVRQARLGLSTHCKYCPEPNWRRRLLRRQAMRKLHSEAIQIAARPKPVAGLSREEALKIIARIFELHDEREKLVKQLTKGLA